MAPRRRTRQSGKGFWDSVKKVAGGVNNFLKDTKAISRGATMLANSGIGGPKVSSIAGTVGNVAGSLGYGKRRRSARTKRGGAMGTRVVF